MLLHPTTTDKSDQQHLPNQIAATKHEIREQIKAKLKSMTAEENQISSQRTTKSILDHQIYQNAKCISLFTSLWFEFNTIEVIHDVLSDKNNKVLFLPRCIDTNGNMSLFQVFDRFDHSQMEKSEYYSMLEPNPVITPIIQQHLQSELQKEMKQQQQAQNNNNQHYTTRYQDICSVIEAKNPGKTLLQNISSSTQQAPLLRPEALDDGLIQKLDLILCPLIAVDNDLNRIGYGFGFFDRYLMKLQQRRTELGLEPVKIFGVALDEQFCQQQIPTYDTDIQLDGCFLGDRVLIRNK